MRLIALLPLLLAATPALAADDPALTALLQAKTQAMIDAIPIGDKKVWDAAIDPDVIYVDENNVVMDKATLLAALNPLPAGLIGKAFATHFQARRYGDVAVTTYINDEGLDYHGQHIQTKFRSTETWALRPDGWKIVASETLAALDDPPAIALPATKLADYAGTYALTPDIKAVVRADGEKLISHRGGRPDSILNAEAPDLFFIPGSPRSRRVFLRDASGHVTGYADRREGHDIMWKRVG
jgi:hypothetical protein